MLVRQDQRQVVSQKIDPKLIMANAILQQSAVELAQQIEAELLDNPALDILEQEPICDGNCANPQQCPVCSQRVTATDQDSDAGDSEPGDFIFNTPQGQATPFDVVGNLEASVTLPDHLLPMLRAAMSDEDYAIAEYLVNCLDEKGWLGVSLEEAALDLGVSFDDADRVLRMIHTYDPPGVGARDLRECLLIQLQFLREEGHGNALVERIVRTHFDHVIAGRFTRIARSLRIPVEKARQCIDFMRTHLNPYPASQFRPHWAYKPANNRSPVRPDVAIRRTEVGYEIDVVGAEPYLLGISPTYRAAYEKLRSGTAAIGEREREHITEYVERAELFIRNLKQRRRTLRMITRCLVDCQQGFLETSSRSFLRPLTRTHVAQLLGMHESTISRATAGKYVRLPNQEVVPFDVFFDSSLSVRTAIAELVADEDPSNPLSDQQIAEALADRGVQVARRTIVKYRDALKIPPSNRRRR